jgi:hypothetical protein
MKWFPESITEIYTHNCPVPVFSGLRLFEAIKIKRPCRSGNRFGKAFRILPFENGNF